MISRKDPVAEVVSSTDEGGGGEGPKHLILCPARSFLHPWDQYLIRGNQFFSSLMIS
jgi:hypothetical protein